MGKRTIKSGDGRESVLDNPRRKLDKLEYRRLRTYLDEATGRIDELSDYERKFVNEQQALFDALDDAMTLSVNQWELWFRIDEKLNG